MDVHYNAADQIPAGNGCGPIFRSLLHCNSICYTWHMKMIRWLVTFIRAWGKCPGCGRPIQPLESSEDCQECRENRDAMTTFSP